MSKQQIDTLVSSGTIITYSPNGTAQIEVLYDGGDSLPNVISTFLAQLAGTTLGTTFLEGDLIVYLKNYPGQINLQVNANGELLLYTSTGDATNYSVDPSSQNLNYTKTV